MPSISGELVLGEPGVTRSADRWITLTTIGCVALLALIAGTVSYLHMHRLVALHGQPGWVAALTPLSVDGMIVAASTTLLYDSRSGRKGGIFPRTLLIAGSVASLAANVAVAEPTLIGRVIAAWPSFALTASYELLTRQVRRSAVREDRRIRPSRQQQQSGAAASVSLALSPKLAQVSPTHARPGPPSGEVLQRQAWLWALAREASDGSMPSGKAIANVHGRHERWGRLVKSAGKAGLFSQGDFQAAADR
jgi:Protein of unknown function (DUF2637)